ncbi:MAG TPA: hypothetical protein VFC80_01880 [Sphaerochaeta sp.]|nr:hypothetical protein [Sphaerochaeta sp.]
MHKPRLRKSLQLLALLTLTLMVFSACSAVFTANVGGKVREAESGAAIVDMAIYAYTNTAQRDSDWDRYTGGTFIPSNAAGYVARTNSDANGSFVINKIIWESAFPEFGKTADYKEIALLFYHEDYGLHKNSNPVWITSDSTNVSMVDEQFSKVNQSTDIRIFLRDVADETLIDESFDVRLAVLQEPGDTAGNVKRETIRGTGTIAATYPVALDETIVTATATLQNSSWMQCDEEGTVIPTASPPSFTVSGNNSEITLYLKQSRHAFPLISGEIHSEEREDATNDYPDNSLTVWLGEWTEENQPKIALFDKAGAQTITRSEGTGANNSVIHHGIFSNLGAAMHWDDSDYSGTYADKTVIVVVDMNRDRKLSAGDYYHEFTIRSDQDFKQLGKLRWNADSTKSDLLKIKPEDLP